MTLDSAMALFRRLGVNVKIVVAPRILERLFHARAAVPPGPQLEDARLDGEHQHGADLHPAGLPLARPERGRGTGARPAVAFALTAGRLRAAARRASRYRAADLRPAGVAFRSAEADRESAAPWLPVGHFDPIRAAGSSTPGAAATPRRNAPRTPPIQIAEQGRIDLEHVGIGEFDPDAQQKHDGALDQGRPFPRDRTGR